MRLLATLRLLSFAWTFCVVIDIEDDNISLLILYAVPFGDMLSAE